MCMCVSVCMCVYFTLHMHFCVFVLVRLLPAVDDLVHVVLGGEPAARLLGSAPLLPLFPLQLSVLQSGHRALAAV